MSRARPFSLSLYAAAARAISPLAPLILRARIRRGKEDPERVGERLGRASLPRPPGLLAWLHGASVGEGLSLLPLVARFRELRPEISVLVTSGTRTSAKLLGARLPVGAFHQFAPVDTPGAVDRFIAHWRPDIGVFVESELWPNLIGAAKTSGARLALISAKMSDRSFDSWRRLPGAARATLAAFDLILARDQAAGARVSALGGRLDGLWDAKLGAPPLPADERELAQLQSAFSGRAVILAASTHAGEEAAIVQVFAERARQTATALLILIPRHPARGSEVAGLARAEGLTVARRSVGESVAGARVYVVDTLGELGLFYRLAGLAVVGGSLVGGVGGHNPLEAARLGCPFAAGPHVDHWPIYETFLKADATRRLEGLGDLVEVIDEALVGAPGLSVMAERAAEVARRCDESNQALAPRLLALLDR